MIKSRLFPIIICIFSACIAHGTLCSCMAIESLFASESRRDTLNTWLEVDTLQFRKNISYLKSIMGNSTKVCVVMKGDAYGYGISTLMPAVMREGINDIAITSNQEAKDVRASGYKGRIMRIRLATEGEIREGIDLGIDELIGNIEQAEYINKEARKRDKVVSFHLAINANGMSRNGIELKNGYDEALDILKLKNLRCIGMMTHYPANLDGEIHNQCLVFQKQTEELIQRAGLNRSDITLSTAATYSALYMPETRMDMVRVGTALYSYGYTNKFDQFKKIMAFKSRVTSVQSFPAGNTVSYKRTHKLNRKSRLANIPIGYANGLSTNMSNKGFMLIRGHRCPIVGNITMNITMVDVTDFPDIEAGDEVVIYGHQGAAEITSKEIATWSGNSFLNISMFWGAANPKVAVETLNP